MSDFLSIASGLVGGISSGLEKRGEKKVLEEARAEEVRRFELEMEQNAQQFAMQQQLADSRLKSDEITRKQAETNIQRLEQELENVRPREVERFNPLTGETQTFTLTPDMISALDFEQLRAYQQGQAFSLADGTKVLGTPGDALNAQEQATRSREFQQRSELDLFRTALQTTDPTTGQPLINNPETRQQLIEALSSVFRNRTPAVPLDPFGPPLASPDVQSPGPLGAGGRPEDAVLDTSGLPSSGVSTLTVQQLEEAAQGQGTDPSAAAQDQLEALFRKQLFGERFPSFPALPEGGAIFPALGVGARPSSSAGPPVVR